MTFAQLKETIKNHKTEILIATASTLALVAYVTLVKKTSKTKDGVVLIEDMLKRMQETDQSVLFEYLGSDWLIKKLPDNH